MEIQLSLALLRPWRLDDAESLVRHANDREVWRNLRDRFPHPYTAADAAEWVARASAESPLANFAIEVDGEAAGSVGLTLRTDIASRSAEIGYWLGRAHWGRGIATEAAVAASAYAFATFDLIRLDAAVFGWNPASARVLEKAGYRLEGRLRDAVTKDGETTDMLMYALLRSELEGASG